MTDSYQSQPEEQGQLVPPSRRPPTAVGTMTPPPPPPPGGPSRSRRRGWWYRRLFESLALTGGGVALSEVAPWIAVRLLGLTLALTGAVIAVVMVWARFMAPAIALRRHGRWLRGAQTRQVHGSRRAA